MTKAKLKIKTGDTVKVISGKDKGAQGEVLSVQPQKNRVVVQGVNMIHKAMRPTQINPAGGIDVREAAIDVSNVMLVCPDCGLPTRVGYRGTGHDKVRVCKKCGKDIDK